MSAKCINCGTSVGCSCKLMDGKYCSLNCKKEYENKTNSVLQLSEPKISTQPSNQFAVSPN